MNANLPAKIFTHTHRHRLPTSRHFQSKINQRRRFNRITWPYNLKAAAAAAVQPIILLGTKRKRNREMLASTTRKAFCAHTYKHIYIYRELSLYVIVRMLEREREREAHEQPQRSAAGVVNLLILCVYDDLGFVFQEFWCEPSATRCTV